MTTIPRSGADGDNPVTADNAGAGHAVAGHAGDANAATNAVGNPGTEDASAGPRVLTPAAQRALAEAAERRRLRDAEAVARPTEVGGRGGPDPVRFGDWEKGGIAWDF
jgi:hypothetical protein